MLPSCAHTSSGPALPAAPALPGGLTVKGTRFIKDGKPFFISGINYWAGPTLARDGNQAGWDQVRRDLDGIQAAGLNMIRTCVATEGPDSEPYRIVPTIQPAMGQYDPAGHRRRDALLRGAPEARPLRASTCSTTSGSGRAASPSTCRGRGRARFRTRRRRRAAAGIDSRILPAASTTNQKAVAAYNAFINFLVPKLAGNPMIIWELANEPRGMKSVGAYRKWIDATARMIKSLAPSQLVTTGSEGQTASPVYAGMNVVDDHQSAAIDFICFHMWAANWGWVNKENLAKRLPEGAGARQEVHQRARGRGREGGQADPARGVRLPARRRQLRSRVAGDAARSVLPGGVHAGAFAAGDDADGGHHAVGVGGRQPAAAARGSSGSRAIRSSAIRPTRSRAGTACSTRTRR